MEYFGIEVHFGGFFLYFNLLKFHLMICKIFLLFLKKDRTDIYQTYKQVTTHFKRKTTQKTK